MGVVLMPPNLRPNNTSLPPGVKLMPRNLMPKPVDPLTRDTWIALFWAAAFVLAFLVFKVPKKGIKWFLGLVLLSVALARWDQLKGYLPSKG